MLGSNGCIHNISSLVYSFSIPRESAAVLFTREYTHTHTSPHSTYPVLLFSSSFDFISFFPATDTATSPFHPSDGYTFIFQERFLFSNVNPFVVSLTLVKVTKKRRIAIKSCDVCSNKFLDWCVKIENQFYTNEIKFDVKFFWPCVTRIFCLCAFSFCAEPRPSNSILTPTLGILSGVVLLLCIAGIVVVVFLRRQCIREAQAAANNDGIGNASNGGLIRTSESTLNQTNGTAGGASTISKAARGGGVNPRSQSLKPLMDSVDCNLDAGGGGPMFVSRIEPDHWKNQMFCHTGLTQLGWPVGEPPPSAHSPSLPPPPPPPNMMMTHQQSIEAGLITPPYTTDSSLDLRSPDIIPPPIIGKMQLPFHVETN